MIAPVRQLAGHRISSEVSTRWLASVLVGFSLLELAILRVGTRTAIHIPGLEQIAGPYRLFAATGRLSFYIAVVLLVVLLPYMVHDLCQSGRIHTAAALSSFVLVAGLGALRLIDNDVMAPAITAIIASLAFVVLARQRQNVVAVVGIFVAAFIASAMHTIIESGVGAGLNGGMGLLPQTAEMLAVFAAVLSGPLIRWSLGLGWPPARGLAWTAGTVGFVFTAAIVANASTVHILMLWNFGLTGALPAPAYGLAVASVLVAVVSGARCGHQYLALALSLFFLGGIGLTSTYQSGLIVAGLGLLDLAPTSTGAFQHHERPEPIRPE